MASLPCPGFPQTQLVKIKMTGDCCVFTEFLQRSVGGKQLVRFQSETSSPDISFAFCFFI